MAYKKFLLFIGLIHIVGCGGNSDTVKENESVPLLNTPSIPLVGLSLNSRTNFERHLKNGIYLRTTQDQIIAYGEVADNSAGANVNPAYSTTNLQEVGVDEADRIKYDGEHLFIAHQTTEVGPEDEVLTATTIRIMRRENNGEINSVSSIDVNQNANDIAGIYFNESALAVLSKGYSYGIYNASNLAFDSFFPVEQEFQLSLVSVDEPSTPVINESFTMTGSLIDSRRIGNILYVISSYSATIPGLAYAYTEAEKLANYNLIAATDINDLLPKYTDSEGVTRNLLGSKDCLLPESATDKDGFDGLVTLTSIDLTNPSQMNSVCINSQVQGLYATPNAIYLYGTDYEFSDDKSTETSIIHKFSIQAQDISYQASGLVNGRFNWGASNLRFSEQGDFLRVVTSTGNNSDGYLHKLNVLLQTNDELAVVAQLPNDINPHLIGKIAEDGKVYEDIKAVRFFDNQAYIVTFLNTDPLYIVDLENNLSPVISGELEIPGYSAYLHPISESLLLGIGQSVDPNRLNGLENNDETVSPIIEGAKVSLFDISDTNAPKELSSIVYENAYTPVEYDYHALTSLTMENGSHRFALPLERWVSETVVDENQQRSDIWYPINKLALLTVTSNNNDAQMVNKGHIEIERDTNDMNYTPGWDDRALFHYDDIYYIHGHQVWHSNWTAIEGVTGPF